MEHSLMELTCVASVMIGNHCIRDVLLKLARCLAVFPNLQVFRLDHTERKCFHINQAITYYGFGRYTKSFPQIRSATIPDVCYNLLKLCPNAQVLWLYHNYYV